MKNILNGLSIVIMLFIFSGNSFAQVSGKVTGKVIRSENQPGVSASVSLHRVKDSALMKSAITNEEGQFEMEGVKEGNYFMQVSLVGHQLYKSETFAINLQNNSKTFGALQMQANTGTLKEVTVVAKKPFIENQIDKIVINVEGSIVSAGSSALEILERSPGIIIDNNDNISMRGRQGIIVMIDNKPTPMSGADLANMLRGMPSTAIEKIELISNPSARYDASGNAGMINIRMKKDQRLGTNGNFSMNYGQGNYPKGGTGLSLNNRGKKVNIFGSYNFLYTDNFSHLTLFRQFFDSNRQFEGAYDGNNTVTNLQQSHSYRAGLDFSPTRKTVIGFIVNGFNNTIEREGDNFSKVIDEFGQSSSTFSTNSFSRGGWDNIAFNLNYKTVIDSTGKELTADADYASYKNIVKQDISTLFKDNSGNLLQNPYLLQGNTNGELTIKSLKIDYTNPLKKGAKLEMGAKISLVTADNELLFYDGSNGAETLDSGKSNHFIYDENINAAYISLNKQFKFLSLQFGLRGEQTNAKGRQLFNGKSFDTTYFQLFPTIFLQKNLSEKHTIGLTMGRRIGRPSYNQLNPFVFFIDPSTYQAGNPYLKPQSTYNIEFSHTYNHKIITSVGYAHTKNVIGSVIMPDTTQTRVAINTDVNLTSLDNYSLSVSLPIQVAKWWNSINNFIGFYGHYKGNLSGSNLSNGIPAFSFNSNNSFTFKKGWSAELTGFFMSRHRMGYLKAKSFAQIGSGVQKIILQKRGTIRFNITDILYSGFFRANSKYHSFEEDFKVVRDTRVVRLTFTYRFGRNTIAPSRRRNSGAEEEKQRVNTGN